MKKYGLLGKNIGYSLSPAMHNAAYRAMKMDAVYELFDMDEEKIEGFFSRLRAGEIEGCNVTIPYKEIALGFLDRKSSATSDIGAVNTVVRRNGILEGHNTDYIGFMMSLCGNNDDGDLNFNPEGHTAFIFGAGGAAKSIVYVLTKICPVKKMIISDIDNEKAEKLADYTSRLDTDGITISVANDEKQYIDFVSNAELLINATPCGMRPEDTELFDYRYIEQKHRVFDLIYAVDTPLIRMARESGAKAINGLNMLLYQAKHAFEHMTGNRQAPIDVMKSALLEKVKR